MIWTEDLKLLTFHFLFILQLSNYQYFFKAKSTKKTTTDFQLNLSVLSYINLLLVFIEFSKKGDR